MRTNIKLLLPASLLVLGTALSGCSAGQQVTAADVVQKMRETMKTTQTAQSTIDIDATINKQGIETLLTGFMPPAGDPTQPQSVEGPDITSKLPDTASAQLKVWKQAPDTTANTPAKVRVEVVSSSLPGVGGLTLVFDGDKAYLLDSNRQVLYTGTPAKLLEKLPAEAKAAMQGVDVETQIDKVIDAAEIKLEGTEQVAGIEAYKLDITPKPDAAEKLGLPKQLQMQAGVLIKDLRVQLWVDKDRWIPLKAVVEHPNIGTLTGTASAVEINQPVDASTFVLQAGPDVKVVDVDQMAESAAPKTLTLPKARELATGEGWTLLEATYPADATLVGVNKLGSAMLKAGGDGNSLITLSYSSPSSDFTIAESNFEMEQMLGDDFSGINGAGTGARQEVTVRGVKAVAFSPQGGNWTALVWQDKTSGLFLAVRGNLTVEEAVKIAEGLR